MRVHAGVVAQELLQAVAERMDVPQGELVLVTVTYPGGKYANRLQCISNYRMITTFNVDSKDFQSSFLHL